MARAAIEEEFIEENSIWQEQELMNEEKPIEDTEICPALTLPLSGLPTVPRYTSGNAKTNIFIVKLLHEFMKSY